MNLQDLVLEIVKDFINNDKLFTALDISNVVKQTMPHARHKEVRDIVRELWKTEIEVNNYDRSPIQVTLANGSTADALLYHPLSASWDLDNLYNAQQRQKTFNQNVTAPTAVQTVNGTLSKSDDGTLTVVTTPAASLPVVTPSVNPVNTRDLWAQMWQTQPSLFPRK